MVWLLVLITRGLTTQACTCGSFLPHWRPMDSHEVVELLHWFTSVRNMPLHAYNRRPQEGGVFITRNHHWERFLCMIVTVIYLWSESTVHRMQPSRERIQRVGEHLDEGSSHSTVFSFFQGKWGEEASSPGIPHASGGRRVVAGKRQ